MRGVASSGMIGSFPAGTGCAGADGGRGRHRARPRRPTVPCSNPRDRAPGGLRHDLSTRRQHPRSLQLQRPLPVLDRRGPGQRHLRFGDGLPHRPRDDRRDRRLRPDRRQQLLHPRQHSARATQGRALHRRPRDPGAGGGAGRGLDRQAGRAAGRPGPAVRRGPRSSGRRSPSPSRAGKGTLRVGSVVDAEMEPYRGPTGEVDHAQRVDLHDDPRRARLRRQGHPLPPAQRRRTGCGTSTCADTTRSRAVSASRCNRRWPDSPRALPAPGPGPAARRGRVAPQEEAQRCRSASTTAGRFSSPSQP